MNDALTVPAGERGVIRVFALDMPAEQARFQAEPGAAAQMLGVAALDDDQVEVIRVADLEELGLSGYLIEGCGIAPEQIAPDAAKLAEIKGYVLLVRSKAFAGKVASLSPDPRVSPIGLWSEPGTDWTSAPIETESARPYSAPRPSPREARSRARRIGATLFAVVMGLIALVLYLVIT